MTTKANSKPKFKTKGEQMFELKTSHAMKRGDWDRVLKLAQDYEAYERLVEPLCFYEQVWTDEVGDIMVCQVHGEISKYDEHDIDPNKPCLKVDPYDENEASFRDYLASMDRVGGYETMGGVLDEAMHFDKPEPSLRSRLARFLHRA